jgi:hypothetical protein
MYSYEKQDTKQNTLTSQKYIYFIFNVQYKLICQCTDMFLKFPKKSRKGWFSTSLVNII